MCVCVCGAVACVRALCVCVCAVCVRALCVCVCVCGGGRGRYLGDGDEHVELEGQDDAGDENDENGVGGVLEVRQLHLEQTRGESVDLQVCVCV